MSLPVESIDLNSAWNGSTVMNVPSGKKYVSGGAGAEDRSGESWTVTIGGPESSGGLGVGSTGGVPEDGWGCADSISCSDT